MKRLLLTLIILISLATIVSADTAIFYAIDGNTQTQIFATGTNVDFSTLVAATTGTVYSDGYYSPYVGAGTTSNSTRRSNVFLQ